MNQHHPQSPDSSPSALLSDRAGIHRRDFVRRTAQLSLLAAMGGTPNALLAATPALRQPLNMEGVSKGMFLALRAGGRSDESLVFLKQIGVHAVLGYTFDLPSYDKTGVIDYDEMLALKQQVEKQGLRLAAMHLDQRALSNLLLGQAGANEDLDKLCRSIEVMGRAGIRFLNYSLSVSRAILNRRGLPLPGHYSSPEGRGGAIMKIFDEARARQVTDEPAGKVTIEEMWNRITRVVQRCVPVAEKAGVVLGLHPDDPPVETFWGVAQPLITMAALERFIAIVPSPSNCLVLCQGTIQEAKIDVLEYIRHFGQQGKIAHVELRGVRGTVPHYTEEFMDSGDLSLRQVLHELQQVGYTGPVEVAHVPQLMNDAQRRIVQAWSVGYLKGLLAP